MSKAARGSGPSGGLVLLVLFLVLGPLLWLNGRSALAQRASGAVAQDFASAWMSHELEQLRYHPDSGPDLRDHVPDRVADETQRITAGLTDAEADRPASVVPVGEPEELSENENRQRLRVTWDLGQGRRWEYDTVLPLRVADGNWMPVWGPSVVHPAVVPGLALTASRIRPAREEVIGGGEQALTANAFVVDVGIRPGDTNNRREETATRVARLLGRDVENVVDDVTSADDEDLVPVVRALPERECARCGELRRTPGVVVTRRLTQSPVLAGTAQQVLGSVQPADEPLRRLDPGRIALGDLVGVGGLQRKYDAWLAGTPGVEVRAVALAGSPVQPPAEPIWTSPPVPGRPLRVTLDPIAQRAADGAVARARTTSTAVVVDVGSGDLLAVATGGPGRGSEHGLSSQVPPGWAFVLPSALALLNAGVTPETPAECPPYVDVGGQRFKNEEPRVSTTLGLAFVRGCRTALAGLYQKVTPEQLTAAAESLGYGRADLLGADAFRGAVPLSVDGVQHAAALLGEGRVLSSPITVARASAAVASGQYTPSRLVLSPEPAPAGGKAGDAPPLDERRLATLQELMKESVRQEGGTAHALFRRGGGEVAAVAGSAAYGPEGAATRHVWCTGYRGNLAFAVLVEGTTAGPDAATGVAARLLQNLPTAT